MTLSQLFFLNAALCFFFFTSLFLLEKANTRAEKMTEGKNPENKNKD